MRALFVARFCGAISFLSSLPSSFCLSFSLSFVVVKKAPRPFCFFFDFFPSFGRDHGSVKRQSSPATGSKKRKSRRQLFRPRFQSAFVSSSSTNPLVFGLCAEKFHRDEKNHILTHALQLQEKCLSQFPPLLAPESSPRRTSAPLPPREEPPRCKSSRKENYGGFAMFFFNTKIASASARARVLEH